MSQECNCGVLGYWVNRSLIYSVCERVDAFGGEDVDLINGTVFV